MTAHWGLPDPAAATGDDVEIARAFRNAYAALERRIELFAALPFKKPGPHVAEASAGPDRRARKMPIGFGPAVDRRGAGNSLPADAVVGSGIMAERLAGGNMAVALLANALAPGAALTVLITIFAPLSGAHFNPAVSLYFALRGEFAWRSVVAYVPVQVAAAIAGVWLTHLMFDHAGAGGVCPSARRSGAMAGGVHRHIRIADHHRRGAALCARLHAHAGGTYITGAYWFTASTSFANPAVTVARALTDSFSGIAPANAPGFIAAQLLAAILGAFGLRWLFAKA